MEVDLAYLDVQLAIEVDGRYHMAWKQRDLDCQKEHEIRKEGWELVRVTNAEVDTDVKAIGHGILALARKRSQKNRLRAASSAGQWR
jgi:very-short-patch-repair endonuclease